MDAFLGIDQSLLHTGIAVISIANQVQFANACDVPEGMIGAERLNFIYDWLVQQTNSYSFISICMEGPSLLSQHREFDLGEISGVVKLFCMKLNVNPNIIPPTTLKQFSTGYGQAKKEDIKLAVKKLYNLNIDDDNQNDAIMLARFAWALNNKNKLTLRHELEALKPSTPKPIRKRIRNDI